MDKLITLMKIVFSTNYVYYTNSHGFHVNVTGPDFYEYHKLLQKVYEDAQENIDAIAEEIRTLQGIVPFNLARITSMSRIKDVDTVPKGLEMMQILLDDTETLCEAIRLAREEAVSQEAFGLVNYLEQRLDDHYKFQWMLRSTLEK